LGKVSLNFTSLFVSQALNPHRGTAAAVTLAIDRGADIIRVHNVEAMSRVARLADAVVRRVAKNSR
jgi:dihydropteroate synthase